jgi:predicted DNA-binding transcriptional regulator AlpA
METNNEIYLTVKELSEKIKYSQQSIYNMIHKGIFIKGTHYIKPSRKKVLFLWPAVHAWLESPKEETVEIQKSLHTKTTQTNKSLINI